MSFNDADTDIKAPKGVNTEKIKKAGYYSVQYTEQELIKRQKIKSVFLFFSAIFFLAGSFIVPPDTGFLDNFKSFNAIFIVLYVITFLIGGYVLYHNAKAFKIRNTVDYKSVPKVTFKFRTFWAVEIYMLLIAAVLIIQAVFLSYSQHYMIIIIFVLFVLSFICTLAARMVLYLTYRDAVFIKTETDEKDAGKGGETDETGETKEESGSGDFYKS